MQSAYENPLVTMGKLLKKPEVISDKNYLDVREHYASLLREILKGNKEGGNLLINAIRAGIKEYYSFFSMSSFLPFVKPNFQEQYYSLLCKMAQLLGYEIVDGVMSTQCRLKEYYSLFFIRNHMLLPKATLNHSPLNVHMIPLMERLSYQLL